MGPRNGKTDSICLTHFGKQLHNTLSPENGRRWTKWPTSPVQSSNFSWCNWGSSPHLGMPTCAALTWKRRMMVQMSPRVRRWFPSTMSWEPMFSRWTLCSFRNCRALSTFSRQWIRIRPLVGLGWNKNTSQVIYNLQKPGTVNCFMLPNEHVEENSCGHSWAVSKMTLLVLIALFA